MMEVNVRFPVWLIVTNDGYPIVRVIEGNRYFVAFQNQELAELYLESVKSQFAQLVEEDELRSISLAGPDVGFVSWNTLPTAAVSVMVPIGEFLRTDPRPPEEEANG